jgi:hypothetical protein
VNKKINFFLDSGAFSAWNKGVEINLYDYIKFIKDNKNYIDYYAVLDDIQNPDKTLENQKIMERQGLNPIPCFHYGEDVKYLNYYINNYDYIALGGMVPFSNKYLIIWLDNLFFNHICDKQGFPIKKIHGFGMTSFKLLMRYPWYSVDSTAWVMCSRYGGFHMPVFKNEMFDWLGGQIRVFISNKNKKNNPSKFNTHYFNTTQEKRKIIDIFINTMGFKVGRSKYENNKEIIVEKGLCNSYMERDKINIKYFMELEKAIPKYPRRFKCMDKMSRRFL